MKTHKRSTSILLWSVVLSVLSISAAVIFVSVFSSASTHSHGGSPKALLTVPVTAIDQMTGNPQAAVTVVVYSDFQCPSCASLNEDIKDLEKDLAANVRFVHRHFPLPQHPNSPLAAFAAEAAGLQGKFWQMRDRLFATQADWSELRSPTEFFKKLASELDLDVERFSRDMKSKEVMEKVTDDFNSAVTSRLQSTPSVFVEGELVAIDGNVQTLRKHIDETLKNR